MRKAVRTRSLPAASVALGLVAVLALPACWSSTCSVNKITTDSLPDATVGQMYSFAFTHNCSGREAASWQLQEGELPPGITLSWDGRLAGTPTATGTFGFSVLLSLTSRASGAATYPSGSDSRAYALTVRLDPSPAIRAEGEHDIPEVNSSLLYQVRRLQRDCVEIRILVVRPLPGPRRSGGRRVHPVSLPAGALGTVFLLATFLPLLAAGTRRLHDAGRSGWLQLFGLVPVAGSVVLIVFLAQPTQEAVESVRGEADR